MPKKKKAKPRKKKIPSKPEETATPGLPPKDNIAKCKKCKKTIGVCLIEISRWTPTRAVVMQRAYGCREHTKDISTELVSNMASWTSWSFDEEDDQEPEVIEEVETADESV